VNSLKDKPKISKNSALAIENLAKSLAPMDSTSQPANMLTPHFEMIA